MPSADFCLLTRHVATQGAAGLIMRRWLVCVSLWDSYPPDSKQICLVLLVNRLNLFRILLMMILPHGKQISPDKNVSFLCTTVAFTLPLEPAGFVVSCQLAQGLSLICNNPTLLPLTLRGGEEGLRTFALRLPFRPGGSAEADRRFLTNRPCPPEAGLPSANTFGSIHYYEHSQVLVQGTFTP